MRVIKSDSGFLAFQKLFRHIVSNHCPIVIWQLDPTENKRNILESRLHSYHLQSKLMHFESSTIETLNNSLPVYVYSEDGQFIFKSNIHETDEKVFSLFVPDEIKMLEEPDVSFIRGKSGIDLGGVWKTKRIPIDEEPQKDYSVVKSMRDRSSRDQEFLNNEFDTVSLDEEEKLFADKRESPRARPKINKLVKVKSEMSEEIHTYKLFDLSRGGIGFITMELELFPKGSSIRVVGFEDFNLDDALIARVMSHRQIDDTQIEFKVGCKFDEGQA